MDEANPTAPPPPLPALRRRNSIATSVVIPTQLTLPSKPLHTSSIPPQYTNGNCNGGVSSAPLDFELASFKSSLSYISLRDILPSTAVNSPTAALSTCGSACEISIRNRLVKQAAWAYLQPVFVSGRLQPILPRPSLAPIFRAQPYHSLYSVHWCLCYS